MIGNPGPWILIAVAVVAVLWWKGYLKLPRAAASTGHSTSPVLSPSRVFGAPRLEDYPVEALSTALAVAARKEAEAIYTERMAVETAKLIREKFSGPFSEPASTGSVPPSP